MELQKDNLLYNLYYLRPTEEQLKSLACLFKTFECQMGTIVEALEHVHQNSSIHHRITLYYLVNEVLIANLSRETVCMVRDFITKHFTEDLKISEKFEFLNKKLLQLEKFWIQKKLLVLDEFSQEELIYNIRNAFGNKEKLIELLEKAMNHFKSQ